MWSAARHRRRIVQTEWRSHHPSRLSAPIRLGHDGRVPQARAIPGVEVVSNDRYARTIEIAGVHGLVAVEPASGHALRVAMRFSRLSALPTIIARVRRVFDLAADPQAVDAQLAEDPILAPLVRRDQACGYQVRGTGSSSPFGLCSVSKSRWPPESAL